MEMDLSRIVKERDLAKMGRMIQQLTHDCNFLLNVVNIYAQAENYEKGLTHEMAADVVKQYMERNESVKEDEKKSSENSENASTQPSVKKKSKFVPKIVK